MNRVLKICIELNYYFVCKRQAKALGSVLFEQVCKQLNLLEADYFGLEYTGCSGTNRFWVDMDKPMNRQLELSLSDSLLRFSVKFYSPDPAQLEEEFTRYLFCMQIKQDLAQGVLQCNDKTAALLASYLVQGTVGAWRIPARIPTGQLIPALPTHPLSWTYLTFSYPSNLRR